MSLNRADLELLNQSINGAANQFTRNREMDTQQQQFTERMALEAEARRAQETHYSEMLAGQQRREKNEEGYHADTLKRLDNAAAAKAADTAAREASQKFKEYQATQQGYIKLLGSQVAANKTNPKIGLSNEDAHAQFTAHLQDLAQNNGDMFDKMTQDPTISLMLKPSFDFGSVPSATQSSVTPIESKDSQGNVLSGVVTGKGAFHATPRPVTPKLGSQSTTTAVNYDKDTKGYHTNTVNKVTTPITQQPTAQPAAAMPTVDSLLGSPAAAPTAQPQNDELSRAMSAIQAGKDPNAVKMLYRKRTGQDFPTQ